MTQTKEQNFNQSVMEDSALGEIRVVVIEDMREVRESLVALIGGTKGFACVGSFFSMETALASIDKKIPNVVLTDIGLPGMSGIDGIKILRERYPDLPTIALTVYDNDDKVFNALCSGASGYLLKNTPPARLLESIKEVAEGGAPMSPEIASRVIKLFRTFRPPETASYRLTPQEMQILKLLVEGHYKKTAAYELGISVNTVSFHLKNIYNKLQVHSKTEAVAKALREGLV
jgi:DNA-binding NarL/FixJ family response regulator